MYFTYVVRPGEAPEGRAPQFAEFFDVLYRFYLRLGFLIQLIGYVGLLLCGYSTGTKSSSLLWLLRAHPDTVGEAPIIGVLLSCSACIVANVLLLAFITVEDDDSSIKQSRGFRAGNKFMYQATAFGSIAWTLTLVSFYASNYYFDDEWFKTQVGGGSDWLLYFTARVCDASALMMYSAGILLMESYHSEGVGEAWGWICHLLLRAAATCELIALTTFGSDSFHVIDTVYTSLLGIGLLLSLLWALMFEPTSHRYDVKMSQSVVRNEYYKSRNAMAYYGPAVVNADGEIDIQAATQQAQACLNSSCCQ